MFESIVLGGGFAFAAVVQPGPLQAFLLSAVAARGWRRTLPAALAPLLSAKFLSPAGQRVLLLLSAAAIAALGLYQFAASVWPTICYWCR